MPRHLDGDVGGGAESINGQFAAMRHAGKAQSAKSDNAGTKQRGGVKVGEAFGQLVDEVLRRGKEFGISAIHRPTGKLGVFAEILAARAAVLANSAGAVQPRNTDSRAGGESFRVRPVLLHYADYLMAGDDRRFTGRQLAFHDVQIRPANAAGVNADQHLIVRGRRRWNFLQLQRSALHRRGGRQNGSLHIPSLHHG